MLAKRFFCCCIACLLFLASPAPEALAQDQTANQTDSRASVPVGFPAPGVAWTTVVKGSNLAHTIKYEALPDDVWRGRPVHRIQTTSPEQGVLVELYDEATRNYITTLRDGKPLDKTYYPDNAMFSWPLLPGKKWSSTVSISDAHRDKWPYPVEGEAVGFEEVKVPAGTFDAFKVVVGDPTRGLWSTTLWYDPQTKLIVKQVQRRFQKNDSIVELFSYKQDDGLLGRPQDIKAAPAPDQPRIATAGEPKAPMIELPDPSPPAAGPGTPKTPKAVKPVTTVQVSEDKAAAVPEALLQLQKRILSGSEAAQAAPGEAGESPAAAPSPAASKATVVAAPPAGPKPTERPVAPEATSASAPKTPAQPTEYTLKRLIPSQEGKNFVLRILAAGPAGGYTGTYARNPYRVILDLKGRWTYTGPETLTLEKELVKGIRASLLPDKLRLELYMNGNPRVEPVVERLPDGFKLTLKPRF
ncbi:MAG: hypothetical protein PWQ57_678 [Desulfovibrionales bacterium]|jgi:hypothetical protein|nr:hypothetical protein [Desulfovibrionales bacterium]